VKALGYVVCNGVTGQPEKMVDGVLWMGSFAHIFSTTKAARRAVARTMRFATRNGYARSEWTAALTILPVQPLSIEEEKTDQRSVVWRRKQKRHLESTAIDRAHAQKEE
jgi:hypothetical protein